MNLSFYLMYFAVSECFSAKVQGRTEDRKRKEIEAQGGEESQPKSTVQSKVGLNVFLFTKAVFKFLSLQ